ncbi:hypothetical protein BDV96DRAFT_654681 [Lophiotrema nucula]|uniref:Uncharacterized protein n=1 Tax=Lophiotrema nucula TaxID=690887 RepID=A0A6A5YHP8_9PLEO|nr:hypothetical protein BDV96DRAFT_654681 [Lophiotrema nucula]
MHSTRLIPPQNRSGYHPGYTYPSLVRRPPRNVPIPGSIHDLNHPSRYLNLNVQYHRTETYAPGLEPTVLQRPWRDDPPPYEQPVETAVGQLMDANASADRRSLAFERLPVSRDDGPRVLRLRFKADDALVLERSSNNNSNPLALTLESSVEGVFESFKVVTSLRGDDRPSLSNTNGTTDQGRAYERRTHRRVQTAPTIRAHFDTDSGQTDSLHQNLNTKNSSDTMFHTAKLSRGRWDYLCGLLGDDRAVKCRLVYEKTSKHAVVDSAIVSRHTEGEEGCIDYDLRFEESKGALTAKLKSSTERLLKKMGIGRTEVLP